MKKTLIILATMLGFMQANAATILETQQNITASYYSQFYKDHTPRLQNFSLIDMKEKVYTNESLKGKYVVVNFWATWCPPCLKEIPALVKFYKTHHGRVEILGLNYEQINPHAINKFVKKMKINYPIILFSDANAPQFDRLGSAVAMPTTYVYDPKGKLVASKVGEIDIKFLEQAVRRR